MASNRVEASLFDLLPFDIQLKIYKQKHDLECKQVLNIIDKLRFVTIIGNSCNAYFEMSLNKTLSPVWDVYMRNGLFTHICKEQYFNRLKNIIMRVLFLYII